MHAVTRFVIDPAAVTSVWWLSYGRQMVYLLQLPALRLELYWGNPPHACAFLCLSLSGNLVAS